MRLSYIASKVFGQDSLFPEPVLFTNILHYLVANPGIDTPRKNYRDSSVQLKREWRLGMYFFIINRVSF